MKTFKEWLARKSNWYDGLTNGQMILTFLYMFFGGFITTTIGRLWIEDVLGIELSFFLSFVRFLLLTLLPQTCIMLGCFRYYRRLNVKNNIFNK